eukprot:CAMPEP_0176378294 /NCGR_PEP_ID=MMETSP0126-20121128/29513_1 /TAXON_ID=141414 ORGANISM="Strombidinopsis acuminatum, Strain SPMC142" /NCGR_SAMPLE_ID=MMETSP0126 /ASSEMBLY_ACC=CAM_ASM_000229 /LENGTH=88 /DNA_ID=CAMNT_0017740525 /DNA_START=130 /DNA_END=396 /DNA_ORIENTATION=+
MNKDNDNDWFNIESNEDGTIWSGKCWYVHNLVRYEFDLRFEIPAAYPAAPMDLELPELDGKTVKMYRGHALAAGLGPWMAAEVPVLVE